MNLPQYQPRNLKICTGNSNNYINRKKANTNSPSPIVTNNIYAKQASICY